MHFKPFEKSPRALQTKFKMKYNWISYPTPLETRAFHPIVGRLIQLGWMKKGRQIWCRRSPFWCQQRCLARRKLPSSMSGDGAGGWAATLSPAARSPSRELENRVCSPPPWSCRRTERRVNSESKHRGPIRVGKKLGGTSVSPTSAAVWLPARPPL